MLNENEIAVCISGLARDGYETAIKNVHKVFPYDTFYLHWEGYDKPDVPNCILVKEPIIDYHCSFDTQYKPDCKIWKYIHRLPDSPNDKGGKIWWKPNYDNVIKQGFKQLLGHYYLINSLPEKYKTIIRIRYDLIVSTKVDFKPYLELAQKGISIGFGNQTPAKNGPTQTLTTHYNTCNCSLCSGWQIWDYMYFHRRDKFKNVEELYKNKNLAGGEWGLYQILCHQWNDRDYLNVWGGTTLIKRVEVPKENWINL